MMLDAISNLIVHVQALLADACRVTIHGSDAIIEVRIVAKTATDANTMAHRLGCTEYRIGRGGGYEWPMYRTPDFWGSGIGIEVTGPHGQVDESVTP